MSKLMLTLGTVNFMRPHKLLSIFLSVKHFLIREIGLFSSFVNRRKVDTLCPLWLMYSDFFGQILDLIKSTYRYFSPS